MDKESARLAIAELMTEFRDYRKGKKIQNETELSDKFVRPLFRLLGWDAKDDYSLEEHIAGKFADIGYYVDGVPAFFVETKDVDRNIRDEAQHDAIVTQVERMLDLQRQHQLYDSELDDRRHEIAAQIAQTDKKIDQLVYALYGLTADDIAIIEGNAESQ